MYTHNIIRQNNSSSQIPDDNEVIPPLDHCPFMRYYSAAYPHVYRYIYSLIPRKADADEVMQETSVVLWQKFEEFQPDRDFTRWACGIARLVVLESLRKQRRFIVGLDEQLIKELSIRREERYELLEIRQEFLEECKEQLDQQDLNLLDRYYNSQESDVPPSMTRREKPCNHTVAVLQWQERIGNELDGIRRRQRRFVHRLCHQFLVQTSYFM
ncbi:sigma-70 family RNA polymerase sigma factor [Gimesia maris]|uniref:sigma-70 family RNA polymerase sigma factor n=1 Tax=Gimesia maris TaxID=122 RepID=UPI0030DB56C4